MIARALDDLVRMSRTVGGDPTLVQAGGGNTSVKDDDGTHMFIKASGTPLGEMTAEKGFRRVRVAPLLDLLADDALMQRAAVERESAVRDRMLAACDDERKGRPSVEAPLHAFLERSVCHVHSVAVNGLLCARRGREAITDLYSDGDTPPLYVPYCDPGLPLARRAYTLCERFRSVHDALPALIFLENHGLCVSTGAADAALTLARECEARARAAWRTRCPAGFDAAPAQAAAVLERVGEVMVRLWASHFDAAPRVCLARTDAIMTLARRDDAPRLLAAGCLTPDHVVYAHGAPLWLPDVAGEEEIEASLAPQLESVLERQSQPPRTVLVGGLGLVVIDPSPPLLDMTAAATAAALESLLIAETFGGVRGLTPEAQDYIENWEVEQFRRQQGGSR